MPVPGGDDLEIVERLRSPFEEFITLIVALIFQLDIVLERLGRAEFVDHDRVVDDEMDRDKRVDLGRVAAKLGDCVAHRRQVDHARHTGEILHQHARGAILDFAVGAALLLPVDDRLDIVGGDGLAILETQHVLEQDLHREGKPRDVAIFRRRGGERIIVVGRAVHVERGAGGECVLADGGHVAEYPSIKCAYRSAAGRRETRAGALAACADA